jgi:hypothetical protein
VAGSQSVPIVQNQGISTGAIAGIAIGAFAAAVLLLGLVFLACLRKKKKRLDGPTGTEQTTIAGTTVPAEFYGKPLPNPHKPVQYRGELDGMSSPSELDVGWQNRRTLYKNNPVELAG